MSATGTEVSRLLAGWREEAPLSLEEHLRVYGDIHSRDHGAALVERVERSGLRGRGGAGFPTAVKLRAVAAGRGRPVVVANGTEGEPLSEKDKLLLERMPHLVLDGVALAASAVGAREASVCIAAGASAAIAVGRAALAERAHADIDEVAMRLVAVPDGYVAGEESALVHHLNGGPAIPTLVPPRPFERGVGGRPTLVQNVETLAHIALIARFGSRWFREVGTALDPGTALITLSGEVGWPGVYEIALGAPLGTIVAEAGPVEPPRAVLLGGYHGTWLAADDLGSFEIGHEALRRRGAALGCGIVTVLGERACGVCATAPILEYLAQASAGQCGPCTFGLRAIADRFAELSDGVAPPGALEQLHRWAGLVERRGACHHPDGAARLLRSTLETFADDVHRHARGGRCT